VQLTALVNKTADAGRPGQHLKTSTGDAGNTVFEEPSSPFSTGRSGTPSVAPNCVFVLASAGVEHTDVPVFSVRSFSVAWLR
jgi:hypothetical protein